MLTTLDLLYIALAVSSLLVAVPLSLLIWRAYKMMDRVEHVLQFGEKMVGVVDRLQAVPLRLVEGLLEKLK